ncbi:MAG: DUF423 domain-containing protein [Cryomorphaceae bacterium]|nr:DUF423 domain-containing protein [Cryomorphaceae bacterium]
MLISKKAVVLSLFLIITGITAGALGAHMLKSVLSASQLQSFEVGVRYQMYSGIGVLALTALSQVFKGVSNASLWFILVGTVCFSWSIYCLLALPNGHFLRGLLGPITPLGGGLMIFGWTWALVGILRRQSV